MASIMVKIPTMDEYMQYVDEINTMFDDVYRYLNFNEMEYYTAKYTEPVRYFCRITPFYIEDGDTSY